MDRGEISNVKYKSSSEMEPQTGGETTPNDDFWEYSAASKSVFLFDDEDEDASWDFQENHFSKLKAPSIGTKTSTNTSTTSSFESLSIQKLDDHITVKDHKSHTPATKKASTLQSSYMEVIPINVTISNIVRNEAYLMELYRSKEDKIALLDSAIASGDGNAIIATVLHLRRTLKPPLFSEEIRIRPTAVSHFINFLRNHFDFDELYSFLTMLGRTEEAALLKLKLAFSQKNAEQKIVSLENCRKLHFATDPSLNFYSEMIHDQITLLQKQLAIAKSDEMVQNQRMAANQQQRQPSPPPTTAPLALVGMPVITSLYYCTLHHFSEPENSFSSPVSIKKSYKLSDKQYTWTVVSALAKKKDWNSIQLFLTTKSLFGGSKLRSCISFEKIATILHKANAPPDETIKYLKLIDPVEERLKVAKLLQCHTLAIDTYVLMKDNQGLLAYKSLLKPGTAEFSYIESALRASTVKWKN